MADVEVAGSVFLAEVGGIEHAAAGDLGALVGIPVHGVRIDIARMKAQPAAGEA